MITTIEEFKIFEASRNKKFDGTDLIIVDVQEEFKKYFNDTYIEKLKEYCEDFNRVFQIFDTHKSKTTDYTFPNQVLTIPKLYGGKLDEEDIPYLFTEPMQSTIKLKFEQGFNERDILETINGDYYIYIGGKHKWFICKPGMANLFKKFAKQERKIILAGGAANECLHDIYVTLKAFNVDVEYNFEFIYSSKGCNIQEEIKAVKESVNSFIIKEFDADEMYKYITRSGKFDTRFAKTRDDGKNVFKYFDYSDYQLVSIGVRFFGLIVDNIIVALAHIRKSPNDENTWWLSYLCVDPIYEGKGYASELSDYIFKWFKKEGLTFMSSSYTEQGMIKLKPLFNRLAIKYNVPFIDGGKF